ncbi:MAG: hypothetical protein A3H79_01020 [Candidatus Levybacteria bacterium RIFCSPLOWO2_02_FULL_36_8b]|nr:MAG: hypothetical protein A3H79_01020 [Candidatus Levybacteria bacterium RIFCSPLOWO2_02_FULL_36_8b]
MENIKLFFIGFIILSFLIAFAVGGFVLGSKNKPNQQACTEEAKQCPNGSFVGRTGPNCEFSPCPITYEGKFCGGIAANLPENQCPTGYKCQLDGNYPDASGKCVKN